MPDYRNYNAVFLFKETKGKKKLLPSLSRSELRNSDPMKSRKHVNFITLNLIES